MALSPDLISSFAKLANDKPDKKKETTVNGTYKIIDGEEFVQIDGSDIWTPVKSTVEAETGEKVTVLIKDHTATVTGNITSPSVSKKTVDDLKDTVDKDGNTIKQLNNTITQQGNSITQIDNNITQINNTINQHENTINQQGNAIQQFDNVIKQQGDNITSMNNTITAQGNQITSINNTVEQQGNTIKQHGDTLISQGNTISQQGNTIQQQGNTINQQGTKLDTVNSNIEVINSGFKIEDGKLTGLSEIIVDELETNTLKAKYANIDFANIKMAAIEKLFADSGIIKDLVVSEGRITGELVGVTIKGDLLEGNTVKADKLVVRGEDGLYYKLNVDALGETTASSDEKYQNGLDGSAIVAKSIVAEKIAVDDLVAFGATIGGFHIGSHSLYSGSKEGINNTTAGIYIGDDGQLYIGDADNRLRYYKTTDGKWKLDISADSISFGTNKKTIEEAIESATDIKIGCRNFLLNTVTSKSAEATGGTNQCLAIYNFSDYGYNNLINKASNTYSVGFDWETTAESGKFYLQLGGTPWGAISETITVSETNQKGHSTFVYHPRDTIDTLKVKHIEIRQDGLTGTTTISNLKFESGEKCTDWTPAPEDIDSSINDVSETVNNIQIGGRNLLLGTRNFSGDKWNNLEHWETWDPDGFGYIEYGRWGAWQGIYQEVEVEKGQEYTFSFYAKGASNNGTPAVMDVFTYLNGGDKITSPSVFYLETPTLDEYGPRYSVTFTATANGTIYPRVENEESESWLQICALKLEKGNKATDWTPAPEDTDDSIKESINNLQVGGRNLLVNTNTDKLSWKVTGGNGTITKSSDMSATLGTRYDKFTITKKTTNYAYVAIKDDEAIQKVIREGGEFTLSFDVYCDAAVTISDIKIKNGDGTKAVLDFGYFKTVAAEWTKIKLTGKVISGIDYDAQMVFISLMTLAEESLIEFSNIKLEKGNKATDWTPAPEDIDSSITDAKTEVINTTTSMVADEHSIILKTLENYTSTSEFEDYKETNQTQLEETGKAFDFKFSTVTERVDKTQNDVQTQFEKWEKYIRFEDGNIILGKVGNEITLHLENDTLYFLQNNNRVAYLSNNKLYVTDGEFLNSLIIGKFVYKPRGNGSLSFNKIKNK